LRLSAGDGWVVMIQRYLLLSLFTIVVKMLCNTVRRSRYKSLSFLGGGDVVVVFHLAFEPVSSSTLQRRQTMESHQVRGSTPADTILSNSLHEVPYPAERHSCGWICRPHFFSSRCPCFLHHPAQNARLPATIWGSLSPGQVEYNTYTTECAPCATIVARDSDTQSPTTATSAGL
jgi:hypothetical protein